MASSNDRIAACLAQYERLNEVCEEWHKKVTEEQVKLARTLADAFVPDVLALANVRRPDKVSLSFSMTCFNCYWRNQNSIGLCTELNDEGQLAFEIFNDVTGDVLLDRAHCNVEQAAAILERELGIETEQRETQWAERVNAAIAHVVGWTERAQHSKLAPVVPSPQQPAA
jgi:hypothetical protein